MRRFYLIALATAFFVSCSGHKELYRPSSDDPGYEHTDKIVVRIKASDVDISALPKEFAVLNDPRSGAWSVEFYDMDKKETLFDYNKNKNLLPASNLKIVTTAAALKVLGPDYRFRTDFFIDGYIDRKLNLLMGNLYAKGSGDPTIAKDIFTRKNPSEFKPLIDSLRVKRGIDYIEGDLKILTPFKVEEAFGKGWDLDDLTSYYSAAISPVTWHENLTKVTVNKNSIEIVPPYPFKVKLDTVPDLSKAQFRRLIGSDSLIISSDFQKSVSGFVTVKDPDIFFKNNLKAYLSRNNVVFRNKSVSPKDTMKFHVFTLYSDSLYKIIDKCNGESNNLYAEQLFRETAEIFANDTSLTDSLMNLPPTYENLLKINSELYTRLFGIDNFNLCDGSGLSRMNFFSADKLVKVLARMYEDDNFVSYLSSFPLPGSNGTLSSRMTHEDLKNRLFAKTGSMTGVNCLTGYLFTKNGNRIAFSIMNNYYNFGRSKTFNIFEDMLVYFVNNY
jgi:serine-type D-Ala-D-Ala carboxypeptidase/endopeptidase (penicillin-binding protein 4)